MYCYGWPDVRAASPRARITLLEKGGEKHVVELLQHLTTTGGEGHCARTDAGAAHLCLLVDDLDSTYRELSARGVRFVNPLASGDSPMGPMKLCHGQDPEGNWLEFMELPG